MKCPFCGKTFPKKQLAVDHIERMHPDQLVDMDACQTLYYSTHGTIHGTCMCGCGRPTEWNYKTGKPYRVSPYPECKQRIAQTADQRNIAVYGKPKLLDDMARQKEMIKRRKIAGEYTFADGGKVGYVAKLEKNFLWFCDNILEFTSNMILEDDQHGIEIKYYDEQEKCERTYIPDFYLPDYNALVEIKSSNQNPAFIKETKYKERYKEKAVQKQTKYNYIKIVDAKYGPFVEFLANIVREGKTNKNRQFVISETACTGTDDISLIETSFPGLHVLVTRSPILHKVTGIGISESSLFGRLYMASPDGITETTLEDDIFDDDELELYRYAGSKATSDQVIKSVLDLSERSTRPGLEILMDVFKDNNVHYHFDESISTHDAMSSFIRLGKLKPRGVNT